MRAEDQQRIEPTTRLVKTFRNKVGRETAHERLFVFEGIMSLGIGHTTRFKPAIEHFFNTTQRALTLTRWNRYVVNLVTMQICDSRHTSTLFQLCNGSNAHNLFHVITDPQWDRCTPVTVTTHVPVTRIREPVAKAVAADGLGHPQRFFIRLQQLFHDRLHPHEPRWHRAVNQRSAGTPAEGVGVSKHTLHNKFSFRLEVLDNGLVGVLDNQTFVVHYGIDKATRLVKRTWRLCFLREDAVRHTDAIVIFTKCRGLMNHTCTSIGCDVIVRENAEGAVLVLLVIV